LIRILVCVGRAFKDRRLLDQVLDQLLERFGGVEVTPYDESGEALLKQWCVKNNARLATHTFIPPFDVVAVFPGGSAMPLRQAWKNRVPALRVFADGRWVRVGVGWGELLRRFPEQEASR
jgi:hypothetical protein